MASTTTLTSTTDTPKLAKKGSDSKNPTTPAQTVFGCPHIKGLLQNARQQAVDGYTKLINSLRQEKGITSRIHKTPNGPAYTLSTTYLCLQCPNVSISRERHHKNHGFSVESDNGFVFCHECRDFVYDPTFEEIRAGNSKKRKHRPEKIQEADKKLMATNSSVTSCSATGLRGLYNMGQTCFMSVILQSLIHNPIIRAWYLQEGHKSGDCGREACTSCALDETFNEFYGQEKHEGYGAVHMLQACWKGGGGLAGYSQQDAHEFLNFFLNSLHEANAEDDDKKDTKDCECIIHQTFGGFYSSTVTCSTCNNSTTTTELFMDLSLDIKTTGFVTKKKKLPMTNGVQTIKEAVPMDLEECLGRFTSTETLPSDSYRCWKCDADREAKKKISLTSLPPVVPIHLKRFSHSKTDSKSSKVDTRIRFPFTMDLAPYVALSSSSQKSGQSDNANGDTNLNERKGGPEEAIYELSSVIVHKGKIDNGHYISYAKQGGAWFRFDDSMVVQVEEKDVLGAEAYMLFYVVREF
ncbi:ubiquitin carboxyl-terminal hydrolase 8 [Lecanosticta acicola]|uniref:Ubiquitin carboxyl-terminal hydrolase n=1 Tax=Lecanosticta acicola TaxID=111012 RepID=A0AAI9EDZ1_9PEZI|nr:ubiquitin carboxyl-terminal hydrolase 8 [Lecanosticta acicola]